MSLKILKCLQMPFPSLNYFKIFKMQIIVQHRLSAAFIYLLVISSFLNSCAPSASIQNAQRRQSIQQSMVKALNWQEANPIFSKSPTDWTNGAYYTGVARAHKSAGNGAFLKALINMGEKSKWQPYNRINNADDVAISYAYLYLKSINKGDVDLKPTKDFISAHLAWKADTSAQKILWWWCDALFMAPPVINKYAVMQGDMQLLDEMYIKYKETYDLLYDEQEHLFARDIRFIWNGSASDKKEPNGNKVFWSRGNGWVLGGLALILEDMPQSHRHRKFYETLFKEMAAKVKTLQQEDGLWRTSLLSPESFKHGEASGSGFFTFAFAWGINNGLLNKSTYKPAVEKAWTALQKCQQESGKVGWVQDIGFDPRPATADSWQNYGTGAFLLAGSEMMKLLSK